MATALHQVMSPEAQQLELSQSQEIIHSIAINLPCTQRALRAAS